MEQRNGLMHLRVGAERLLVQLLQLYALCGGAQHHGVGEQHRAFPLTNITSDRFSRAAGGASDVKQIIGQLECLPQWQPYGMAVEVGCLAGHTGCQECQHQRGNGGIAGGFPAKHVERRFGKRLRIVEWHALNGKVEHLAHLHVMLHRKKGLHQASMFDHTGAGVLHDERACRGEHVAQHEAQPAANAACAGERGERAVRGGLAAA